MSKVPPHLFRWFLLTLALIGSSVHAGVTLTNDQASFSALGAIVEDNDFEGIVYNDGPGLASPGDPWTVDGVTYTTGNNIIVGPASGLGVSSNVFTVNSFGSPLTGSLVSNYNMFGFDIGTLLASSAVDLTLTTNLGSYNFLNQSVPLQSAMSFFGFIAGSGEYFTGFSITPLAGDSLAALDNVMLGEVTPVPEPTVFVMLLAGLSIVVLYGRKLRAISIC
ncbi:MAG TPA: PEP-CTERM sorting domain-containing protein [Burkholderiales bacterium]|nr:PEP-CTERM sorting domain-containing protein [Burkholderiales bacterium]